LLVMAPHSISGYQQGKPSSGWCECPPPIILTTIPTLFPNGYRYY